MVNEVHDFFKEIASGLKPIAHTRANKAFFGLNQEELKSAVEKSQIRNMVMKIEPFKSRTTRDGNYLTEPFLIELLLLKKLDRLSDYELEQNIINETHAVARQIIAKIIEHSESGECPTLFNSFNGSGCIIEPIQLFSLVGVSLTMTVRNYENFEIDSDLWL